MIETCANAIWTILAENLKLNIHICASKWTYIVHFLVLAWSCPSNCWVFFRFLKASNLKGTFFLEFFLDMTVLASASLFVACLVIFSVLYLLILKTSLLSYFLFKMVNIRTLQCSATHFLFILFRRNIHASLISLNIVLWSYSKLLK